jgi:cell division protein FtsI/penicillin-binding protein 2
MKAFEHTRNLCSVNPGRRISFFMCLFTLLLLCIYVKLFNIQVLDSSRYQLAAKKQYESKISLKPSRGMIFDRKLNALVSNVTMYSFAADPNMVDNKDSVAEIFARAFEKDKSYYLDKLNTNNTSFVWLERRADPQ